MTVTDRASKQRKEELAIAKLTRDRDTHSARCWVGLVADVSRALGRHQRNRGATS